MVLIITMATVCYWASGAGCYHFNSVLLGEWGWLLPWQQSVTRRVGLAVTMATVCYYASGSDCYHGNSLLPRNWGWPLPWQQSVAPQLGLTVTMATVCYLATGTSCCRGNSLYQGYFTCVEDCNQFMAWVKNQARWDFEFQPRM